MRGRWRRAAGLLDRDTRPKGEKRPGVAGPHAVPRHCSTLQKRNVAEALPERLRAQTCSAMSQAYAAADPKQARQRLDNLARTLEREYPGAAASLREGLEETLTIMRLNLPESLARVLSSTIPRGATPNDVSFSHRESLQPGSRHGQAGAALAGWNDDSALDCGRRPGS